MRSANTSSARKTSYYLLYAEINTGKTCSQLKRKTLRQCNMNFILQTPYKLLKWVKTFLR